MESENEIEKQMKTENKLKRSLKARHMNMITIGGSIGTGLFFASGSAVSTAGPSRAILAYLTMGVLVYFLMMSLGQMSTHIAAT